MSAHDPFDEHRAAFGAELRRVTPAVRTRRRRVLALGGASVALAGAATAVVVLAPTTGSRLDVISQAQAALATTPDSILHYAARYDSGYPERKVDIERRRGCKTEPGEVWRAISDGPPRVRIRTPLNPCGVSRLGERIATGSFDIAYGDRTQKLYAESDGFMVVTTGLPAQADEEQATSMLLPIGDSRLSEGDPQDPVARIRSMLQDGDLTDAGELQGKDGRKLRRLTGQFSELRGDPANPKPRTVKVDYRVDAETFAPVQISVTQRHLVPRDVNAPIRGAKMEHRTLTDVTTFTIYETVPLTKETEHLLTVQPKAGTDVTTEAWDENRRVTPKPSKAEQARADKIVAEQIKAGTRVRGEW